MRSLQIAILAPLRVSHIGGAQRHVAAVRDILASLGHTVTLFTEDREEQAGELEQLLSKVLPSARGAAFGRRFQEYPRFATFDVVLSFDLTGVGVKHPRHVRVLAGSYVPFRQHALAPVSGVAALKRTLWTQLFKVLERASTQGNPALACSLGLRDDLRAAGLPVMDEVIFPPVPEPTSLMSRTEAKASAGLKGTGPCLLFAGRWEYAKGADRLDAIIRRLPAHWEVILAVPNPNDVPTAIRARSAMTGTVAPHAMPTFYRAADLTILPTRFEGSSVCLAESMLCNTPVLTTPTGSGKDLQAHNGLDICVVPTPDDLNSWMEALLRFEDRTFYAAAVVRARNFAEARYGFPVITRQWADLLESIVK